MKLRYWRVTLALLFFVIVVYFVLFGRKKSSAIDLVAITNQLNAINDFTVKLKKEYEMTLQVDNEYLARLGFTNQSDFYPDDFIRKNITLPVIVTYAMSGQEDQAVSFAKNVAEVLPKHSTFLYNIGLREYELYLLQNFCRTTHCSVVSINWNVLPSYVQENPDIFRPIIIQDALNKVGAVFYVDSNMRFISDLSNLIRKGMKSGVIGWRGTYPTSTVTHYRMYEYFKVKPKRYFFVPFVDPSKLLIYKFRDIHYGVMLPWIKCVLTRNCIFPVGSQNVGCTFMKKPVYRYSGCHKIGIAPLSIILGRHFKFRYDVYTYAENAEHPLFRNVTVDDAKLELSLLVNSSSDTTYERL